MWPAWTTASPNVFVFDRLQLYGYLLLLVSFATHALDSKSSLQITLNMQEELPRTTIVTELRERIMQLLTSEHVSKPFGANVKMNVNFLEPNHLFYIHSPQSDKHYLRIQTRVDREMDCADGALCCQRSYTDRNSVNFESNYGKIINENCNLVILLLTDIADENVKKQFLVQLTIRVLDVNDNAPSWRTHSSKSVNVPYLNDSSTVVRKKLLSIGSTIPRLDVSIPEHTSIGTLIALPQAIDPDAPGENSTSTYGIESQTVPDAFVLEWQGLPMMHLDNPNKQSSGLTLRVNKDLHYDQYAEHHIILFASDAGRPKQLTGYLLLNISVTDINDHPPKFAKPLDHIWIEEHMEPGTRIYQPNVIDPDPLDMPRLIHDFLPSTPVTSRQLFRIDPTTGAILVNGPVDYEVHALHRLFLSVSDGKWTDEMELLVHVINLNDHPPEIQLHSHLTTMQTNPTGNYPPPHHPQPLQPQTLSRSNFAPAQLTISVRENGPPDQLIATATVTDKDSLAEHRASVFEDKATHPPQRVVESGDHGRFDRIHTSIDSIGVTMRRNVGRPVCSLNSVQLKIEPLEIDAGHSRASKYRFKISLAGKAFDREKQTRLFVQVVCHDQDSFSNDRTHPITYAQTDSNNLDRFTPTRSHSATAMLRILIADENDSPPIFVGPRSLKLSEDATVDSVFARFRATDADDPHTSAGVGGIRFRILPELKLIPETLIGDTKTINVDENLQNLHLPPQPWFHLNAITGELKTLTNFDREVIKSIILPIEITDGGGESASHTTDVTNLTDQADSLINKINVTVTIEIEDANDCVPKFSQQLYEFNVSEDSRPPIRIGKLTVTDCDVKDENHAVEFWLQASTQPTASSTQSEHNSHQSKKDTQFTTPTSTNAIQSWLSVSKNGDLYLRTPHLSTHYRDQLHTIGYTPLDREQNELLVINVFARDLGHPSLTGSAQLLIRVLDVNDNAPNWEFPKPQHRLVNLSADTPVGNRIAQLVANDPDEGPRGSITYSILSGNEAAHFELDSNSGWLYLAQPLQERVTGSQATDKQSRRISTHGRYIHIPSLMRLYVQASDQGAPPRTSSSVLDIIIQKAYSQVEMVQGSERDSSKYPHSIGSDENERLMGFSSESGWVGERGKRNRQQQLHQTNTHRGFLVPSDYLTLIAMITATMAALVLIFIMFVIIRCRRLKPQIRRTPPNNPHITGPLTTDTSPWCGIGNSNITNNSTINSSQMPNTERPLMFNPKGQLIKTNTSPQRPSTFWSRLALVDCMPRVGGGTVMSASGSPCDQRGSTMDRTRRRSPAPGAHTSLVTRRGRFDSSCSVTDLHNISISDPIQSGDVLLYSTKSSLHATYPSDLMTDANDYSLLVHSTHPLDADNSASRCAQIMLNNNEKNTNGFTVPQPCPKYLCTFQPGREVQLLPPPTYHYPQELNGSDDPNSTISTSSMRTREQSSISVAHDMNATPPCSSALYAPHKKLYTLSKSDGDNSVCQPSSFV